MYDAALEEELIQLRRCIHQYAETGGNEIKTSALVRQKAQELQLPVVSMEGTGLVVILDTQKEGKHIALRADMDALPMPENTHNGARKKACVSENPNTCHACGHDAHTAMMIGCMKVLSAKKESLSGVIYFCFEQGEENRSGYQAMLRTLQDYPIDSVYALHVSSALPTGQISVKPGAISTGVVPISVELQGVGGHSARPDQCKNPLIPACEFVSAAYTAIYNGLPPNNSLSMALTTLHCGTARNIIAENAVVEGCMRYMDRGEAQKAKEIVMETAKGIAQRHGCRVSFHPIMNSGYVPMLNAPSCVDRVVRVAGRLWGEECIAEGMDFFASESFGYYTEKYSGVFVSLGSGNEEKGTTVQHHNPKFDIDEAVLLKGVQLTTQYAIEYLTQEA